jgi:exodeoxyribonuclease III
VKIITWNVNSVKARLPRVTALLEREQPDVLCLQEIKVTGAAFPAFPGYEAAVNGQAGRNGVAILSRQPMSGSEPGFPGDPASDQARVMSASIGGLRLVNVYVVNGKETAAPEYDLKLRWLDAFDDWIKTSSSPSDPLLIVGDFNVTPDDRDVWDAKLWRGRNLASEPERSRIRELLGWGLTDLARSGDEAEFTFWDYRQGAFHRGWGLRIDLALGTEPVAVRTTSVTVDRDERRELSGEGKPSDHAPLIVTLRSVP